MDALCVSEMGQKNMSQLFFHSTEKWSPIKRIGADSSVEITRKVFAFSAQTQRAQQQAADAIRSQLPSLFHPAYLCVVNRPIVRMVSRWRCWRRGKKRPALTDFLCLLSMSGLVFKADWYPKKSHLIRQEKDNPFFKYHGFFSSI